MKVTYEFSKCQDDPRCDTTYFNVLHHHTNCQSPQEQVSSTKYVLIERVEQPSIANETVATISFRRPLSNGFYIAIEDVGSCGVVNRIQVYYEHCPGKVVGLVAYPALPLPARNSVTTSVGRAECAPNASNLTLLEFRAFPDGGCERTVVCECLPGYIEEPVLISGTNLFVSQCNGKGSC